MKLAGQLLWRHSRHTVPYGPSRRCLSIAACSDAAVVDVYQQGGALMDKITKALNEKGISTSPLRAEDLTAIDQFHIGGMPGRLSSPPVIPRPSSPPSEKIHYHTATEHLASQLSLPAGESLFIAISLVR